MHLEGMREDGEAVEELLGVKPESEKHTKIQKGEPDGSDKNDSSCGE